jgi:diguanylate cyclase (GGDEF)-like protein/PAS domain S-box-containing protein
LAYAVLISVVLGSAGLAYGVLTGSSIWAYASDEAAESADTLAVSIADAILLENQGALRARGDAAKAVIAAMYQSALETGTSIDATRRQAVAFLAAQQVGDAGYLFAVDSNGDLAYHPFSEVMAENQGDTSVVQRVISQGSGYIRYFWRNPGEPLATDKYGYISYFEPWDWYIVATDYASGFLGRVPPETLRSLLNGYQQATINAAFIRNAEHNMISASAGWTDVEELVVASDAWQVVDNAEIVGKIDASRLLAFAPLPGFDSDVGIVFDNTDLRSLTTQYAYIVAISLGLALLLIYLLSRVAGRLIARPFREMSDRLYGRLSAFSPVHDIKRADDLRGLVLQQLRALVRLDYEARGRRAAEHEAVIAESVFTHTTEGIFVTDADATIIRVNPALEAITGYPADEMLGENPRIFSSGRHDKAFFESMWGSLQRDGVWIGEVWNRRKDGADYPGLLSIRAVRGAASGEIESYVAVCHDISERKEAEERLEHLATHDPLTGLPNRAYLNDVLEHTIRQSRRHDSSSAVLFMDIDNFKDVNDSHGHDTGDELLRWIARQLRAVLREEDIVIRFGGDEFVIVLPSVEDADYASVVARRILGVVREPYVIGTQKMRPSVSIGIAIYPEAGREAGDLLRDADAAMYAAKRQGKNTFRFHNPGMNETAHRRLAMQGSVAAAIDRGELSVAYQPILSLQDNCIAGAEALVRWNRDGRVVLPGEFLPYLENSSMLTRLDLWVLDQACLEINSFGNELSDTFYVTVNAGAYNLIQDDFVARVTETVQRNGVEAHRIAIEVTESAAIRNFDRARATLRELQAAGFKLLLDDFGEGHSSIRYLREFGVNSVKLDRGYLQNVERSESAQSLVSGFTQLAHGMRLRAVIEGVETQGQLDFIRSAGCDFAQGFFIGQPGELSDAIRALEAMPQQS